MDVTVNGKPHRTTAATIGGLLEELGQGGRFIAVAVNREVVRRQAWADTRLHGGDRIEIVSPRQGG